LLSIIFLLWELSTGVEKENKNLKNRNDNRLPVKNQPNTTVWFSQVACLNLSWQRCSALWTSRPCVFVWAGQKDHFCLRRYPRGQLSVPTDISHRPALQRHLVTQLLQRRGVITPAFRCNFAFNPRHLYYQG